MPVSEITHAPVNSRFQKPMLKPADPRFSCGPVKKHPGWSWDSLIDAPLSRTHRTGAAVARIKEAIERTHALLELPEDYHVAIIPHATSCPAVCVSDGHYQNSSEHATFAHVVRMMQRSWVGRGRDLKCHVAFTTHAISGG